MTSAQTENSCKIRPSYDTVEKEDAFEVRIFMPGVSKNGISLSLENDELTINGSKTAVNEAWKPIRRESPAADYTLRLGLNVEIDGEKITAKMEDGVLNLTLPKAEAVKPRRISIQ